MQASCIVGMEEEGEMGFWKCGRYYRCCCCCCCCCCRWWDLGWDCSEQEEGKGGERKHKQVKKVNAVRLFVAFCSLCLCKTVILSFGKVCI